MIDTLIDRNSDRMDTKSIESIETVESIYDDHLYYIDRTCWWYRPFWSSPWIPRVAGNDAGLKGCGSDCRERVPAQISMEEEEERTSDGLSMDKELWLMIIWRIWVLRFNGIYRLIICILSLFVAIFIALSVEGVYMCTYTRHLCVFNVIQIQRVQL